MESYLSNVKEKGNNRTRGRTIGKYRFTRETTKTYSKINTLIDEAIDSAEQVVKEAFNEDLLSFLPEVQAEKENDNVQIHLEVTIRVAPLTPKVGEEEKVVEEAAQTFFRTIEEGNKKKKERTPISP